MRIGFLSLALVVGTISLGSALIQADSLDTREVRKRVDAGELQPLDRLLEQHRERLKGRLLDVEVERKHRRWIYELEVLGADGVVREIKLDATTGEWLKEEIER